MAFASRSCRELNQIALHVFLPILVFKAKPLGLALAMAFWVRPCGDPTRSGFTQRD